MEMVEGVGGNEGDRYASGRLASRRPTRRRSPERRAAHYAIESKLAASLLAAPQEQRQRLYCDVYDELFRRVEDHPQLQIDPARRRREASDKLRFVRRFIDADSCLLEIGAGDCVFSRLAASEVRRVVALDVSEVITAAGAGVENLDVVLSDGTSIPVPDASIDVAYSDQLMEHLHPDDVRAQLDNIARALVPGGAYICVTPNRLTGPHDISRSFTERATGLHLREYTNWEVEGLLLGAGFRHVQFFAGGRRRYVRLPPCLVVLMEKGFASLPSSLRHRLRDLLVVKVLLGVAVVATR